MACVYLDFFDKQGCKYTIHSISSMEIYTAIMEVLMMNWIVRRKYNISDIEININYPEPFFVGRTNDIREWLTMIHTMSLLKIGKACIKFLLLNVLCPYECFSCIQRYRTVSLITTASAYLRPFALFVDLCPGRENRDGTSGKLPGNPVPSRPGNPLSGNIETLGLGT